MELPTTEEIKEYVADFRDFLEEGTIPECKALIRNFVEGIEVNGDEAVLTYTIPMPNDGVTTESASVLDFVKSGPPEEARTPRKDRCGKVHRAPSHISKTVPPTIHLGPETLKKIQSQLGPNDRLLSW